MPVTQTTPTVTTFSPQIGTPTRKTSENDLDAFNKQLRVSPLYQTFMKQRGLPTDGHAKLSDKQQKQLEQMMAANGFPVPKGMHIDQGGNLNQKNYLGRNIAIAAAIGAGTIATLGAAGVIGGGVLGGFGLGGAAGAASVPGAVSGAVPLVGAGAGSSLAAVPTVIGATGGVASAAGAAGAAGAATGIGGAVGGGGAATGGGMGLSSSQWLDVGGKAYEGASSWMGGKSANKASQQALALQDRYNQQLIQLERDKMAVTAEQQKKIDAINERNFKIQEEERLDEMRRLEQKEAQYDPYRVAKEAGYRNYMKKWYGVDVGPTVARTPRQFGVTPTAGGDFAQTSGTPLASQAAPGSAYSIAPTLPPIEAAALPVDPQTLDTAIQYRRPYQAGADY